MKIRISGRDVTTDDDGQAVIGNIVSGSIVQNGRGRQTVIGNIVNGSIVQNGTNDDDDD